MPELPEIESRAREMQQALVGRTISAITVLQPKSLNVDAESFAHALAGAEILAVSARGKWIVTEISQGWFLLNLGMGGEVLLVTPDTLPDKRRLVLAFRDGACLAINFWWVGYAHYLAPNDLAGHEMTARLGPNALEVTPAALQELVGGRRSRIKSLLLDQSQLAGIGNFYIHDILFLARLHPLRTADTLLPDDVERLHRAIEQGLQPSLDQGGAWYELRLDGHRGGFGQENLLVAYREGQACPACGATIVKLKTGGTSSFICPHCQAL
jgi:formamidopyrimidine-DNA glycosylase